MKRPPLTAGSTFNACEPLWATPSSTPMLPVLVKPAGIAPAGVDSKSSDTMTPGGWWVVAQPDTTTLSATVAAANEIFMESPRSPLSTEPIGSPQKGPYPVVVVASSEVPRPDLMCARYGQQCIV